MADRGTPRPSAKGYRCLFLPRKQQVAIINVHGAINYNVRDVNRKSSGEHPANDRQEMLACHALQSSFAGSPSFGWT